MAESLILTERERRLLGLPPRKGAKGAKPKNPLADKLKKKKKKPDKKPKSFGGRVKRLFERGLGAKR